ncbi:acyltransferase [Massilia sp. 9096]|uniref:acyltransferase family protein n=1 Tax=Massilia sp. 9096 TaxID=1500894 RepID=UPI00055A2071|nr:acyltransferase [Massilia sp. 9096]
MKPKFSAYLDVVRFLAALTVFLGHASGMKWTGGFLWQLGGYGDTCVVIFFVLSGFVIAYVTDNKENHWTTYSANRIARLWSVIIPALVLTFVIDYIGVRVAPQLYLGQPWFNGDHLAMRYLVSFFLLNEAWHIGYAPGINQPFWSLSYEAFYYLIFALLTFYKGRGKLLALLIVIAVGGPVVLALLPVWLAGVWIYRNAKATTLPKPIAGLMFVISGVLLMLSPTVRQFASFQLMGLEIGGRYVDAVAFLMNLVAARNLLDGNEPLPARLGRTIKRVASRPSCCIYSTGH